MESLDISKVDLLTATHLHINSHQSKYIDTLLNRRIKREPLAYILGHHYFFGLDFHVNSSTLIPRPETELLVEQVLLLADERPNLSIADIGTGSGIIGISLALHLPTSKIYATDLSKQAIQTAQTNAKYHKVTNNITFRIGDLFANTSDTFDIIVSNLPYIPSERIPTLDKELSWEPILALDGGIDGTQIISNLISRSRPHINPNSVILIEIDNSHGHIVRELAHKVFPASNIQIKQDLQGFDRILIIKPNKETES